MKEERLAAALDARLPDEAARARMWAAIGEAWDAIAAEEGAGAGEGTGAESEKSIAAESEKSAGAESESAGAAAESERSAGAESESAGATAESEKSAAPSVILSEGREATEVEGSSSPKTAGFTVTAGGNAAKKRARRYSWKAPAVAAVLVVAIGTGIIFAANGGLDWIINGGGDPGTEIPDDPTPGHSGGGPDVPGDASEVARTVVTWAGAEYRCVSDEPVDASLVGESLGEGSAAVDGGAARAVEVFAGKGRYATGSYIIVRLDDACYAFISA